MCEAFFELFKDEIAAMQSATEARVRSETEARVRSETAKKMKALEKEIAELKKRLAN